MIDTLAHGGHGAPLGFPALAAAWTVMMAVMMAPTAAPWVRAFHVFAGGGRAAAGPGARRVASGLFASGYLVAWGAYGAALAGAQLWLQHAGLLDATLALPPAWGGALLLGAGLFQAAPLKRACLTHCRNPFTFLLQRWQDGPVGGFRLGLWHGLYCVGCCWALMATALSAGLASLAWMAVLTAAVFVEQVVPRGALARVPIGVALAAAGLWRLAA